MQNPAHPPTSESESQGWGPAVYQDPKHQRGAEGALRGKWDIQA